MSIDDTNNIRIFSSNDILAKYDTNSDISSYLDQILLCNEKINIVSRETSRDDLIRLAADCLVPLELGVNIFGELFDIGPGGGFPSVPLMLVNKSLKAVLIERTGKKADFLLKMKEKYKLNASIINRNFMEAASQLDSGSFDIGLMKYVRLDKKIFDCAFSLLKPDGKLIYYSRFDNSEISDDVDISTDRHCYYLDDTEQVRTITIFSKKV